MKLDVFVKQSIVDIIKGVKSAQEIVKEYEGSDIYLQIGDNGRMNIHYELQVCEDNEGNGEVHIRTKAFRDAVYPTCLSFHVPVSFGEIHNMKG